MCGMIQHEALCRDFTGLPVVADLFDAETVENGATCFTQFATRKPFAANDPTLDDQKLDHQVGKSAGRNPANT